MVGGWVVRDAEFESIAVAIEVAESPKVEAVAPRVYLLNCHGRSEHVEVEAIVDIVPQTGITKHITLPRALLQGKAISRLAIFARIAVAVGVKVDDSVVRGGALHLKARFVIIMSGEKFIVIMRRVPRVDTIGSVD